MKRYTVEAIDVNGVQYYQVRDLALGGVVGGEERHTSPATAWQAAAQHEEDARAFARQAAASMRLTYGPDGPPAAWNVTPLLRDLDAAAAGVWDGLLHRTVEICPTCGEPFVPDEEGLGYRTAEGDLCHADCNTGRVR